MFTGLVQQTGRWLGIARRDGGARARIACAPWADGPLALGESVRIAPLLVRTPMNRIGADTLLKYDMLVDFGRVGFCKASVPKTEGKAEK